MDKKLSGSTLIENIIALLIISWSFIAALQLFSNAHGSEIQLKEKANALINSEVTRLNNFAGVETIRSSTIERDGIRLAIKILPFRDSHSIYIAVFSASRLQGKTFLEKKRVIFNHAKT